MQRFNYFYSEDLPLYSLCTKRLRIDIMGHQFVKQDCNKFAPMNAVNINQYSE